ncbi:MAG: ABC transporter substrate-binding protein [bacterium]
MKKGLSLSLILVVMLVLMFSLTSAADDLVTLKMYYPAGGGEQDEQEMVDAKVNEYLQAEGINVNLERNPLDWSVWSTRMPLILSSGEQADIIFTAEWDNFYANQAKGAFLALDDLLDEYGQGIKDNIIPELLDGPVVNDKLYAIPTNKEAAANNAYFLKTEVIDELDLWDELAVVQESMDPRDLEPLLAAVKENKPDMTPLWLGGDDFFGWNIPVEEADKFAGFPGVAFLAVDTESNTVVNALEEHEGRLASYDLIRDWYLKGYVNNDAATTRTKPSDALKSGRGWIITGSGKPDSENAAAASYGMDFEKVERNIAKITTSSVTGSMLAINQNTKHPDKAMQVIDLLHRDKDFWNLFVWGIEGEHYEKVDENIISLPEDVEKRADTGYDPGINWEIGNEFLSYIWDSENPNKWDLYREYNENAEPTYLLGFVFNPENVKAEIAALNNVWKQYRPIIETGSVDTSGIIDRVNQKFYQVGLDTIIEEAQRQLDEWLEANDKI